VNFNQTKAVSLLMEDCIVDYPGQGALKAINTAVQLTRTSFFGKVNAKTINAENCIFSDLVKAERRQAGCIRFSFVPGKNPETPRRYRCQPELEITTQIEELEKQSGPLSVAKKTALGNSIRQGLAPAFSTVHYGHHAYGQLNLTCPVQITTGADNGSEMGAFCFLQQPQRLSNLRIALNEYLPFGLEAGIFYVT
jgi:hypothetical protein